MAENIFTLDDEGDFSGFSDSCNNYTSSPLCVPQDPIDEIELYPNFLDDSISLSDLDVSNFSSEFETPTMRKRVAAAQECNGFLGNKKPRGKREGRGGVWLMGMNEELWQRKCSHCETRHTPQWRVGPLGPKTLCNACGVRYKSGRLLPEYRPAASPTFDVHVHSNFHRKILKKKKGFS